MPVFPSPISLRVLTAVLCFVSCLVFLNVSADRVSASLNMSAYQKPDQPYGLIFGTVWGPDDHPLYGVKVKVRRADQKKAHWELFSDHNGEFALRVHPGPADYLVSADLKSYKSLTGKELHQDGEVKVHLENDEREELGLHLKK